MDNKRARGRQKESDSERQRERAKMTAQADITGGLVVVLVWIRTGGGCETAAENERWPRQKLETAEKRQLDNARGRCYIGRRGGKVKIRRTRTRERRGEIDREKERRERGTELLLLIVLHARPSRAASALELFLVCSELAPASRMRHTSPRRLVSLLLTVRMILSCTNTDDCVL